MTKPSSLPASPSAVSNSFVRQYYHLLTTEPETLHRFYKDKSCISRCEGSQIEYAVCGQKAINEKILSIGYHNAHVDLESGSVDCQESHDGSVIVMVTGILTLESDHVPRPFVQTFFLATQPTGFFVLNDMFRFLDTKSLLKPSSHKSHDTAMAESTVSTGLESKQHASHHHGKVVSDKHHASDVISSLKSTGSPKMASSATKTQIRSPTTSSLSETPAAGSRSPVHKPLSPSLTSQKTALAEHTEGSKSPKRQAIKSPKQEKSKEHKEVSSASSHLSPKRSTTEFQQGKKHHNIEQNQEKEEVSSSAPSSQGPVTWASKLFTANTVASSSLPSPPSQQAVPVSQPPATAPSARKAPATANMASNAQTKSASGYKQYSQQSGGKTEKFRPPVHAGAATLYIRNLPAETKEEDLRNIFGTYGPIANIMINLPRNFAFVDYANVESMKKAVTDDCKFIIYDKELHVEEKNNKSSSFRQGNTSRGRSDREGRSGNTRGNKSNNGEGSNEMKDKQHDNRSKNDKNTAKRNNGSMGYKQNENNNRS